MFPQPNPVLNEDERRLMRSAPEECFRQAVQRGALSLEQVHAETSPRLLTVLESIVTGERLPSPDALGAESAEAGLRRRRHRDVLQMLSDHPLLSHALEAGFLSAGEAMEAAHIIDQALGRYPTGTLYAVP